MFAKRVFFWAGVYGVAVLAPQVFLEAKIGLDMPPAITHPEYFYGFVSLALVWQLVFLLIAKDPARYRPLMPICVLEKWPFTLIAYVLYFQGRLAPVVLVPASVDFVLGLLFLAAYRATPAAAAQTFGGSAR